MERCLNSGGKVWEEDEVQAWLQRERGGAGSLHLAWPTHSSTPGFFCGVSSSSSSSSLSSVVDDERDAQGRGVCSNSKSSHSQAEKRRRERINAHLSTLSRLIPTPTKLDKASLLEKVVDHVKDLKRKAFEIDKSFSIPTEMDEVTVEINNSGTGLRVSLCCEDRTGLFGDLMGALTRLRLQTVTADTTTIDGRVRSIFLLSTKAAEESVCLTSLQDSLQAALGRVISSNTSPSTTFPAKRLFPCPLYSNMTL